MATYDGRSTYYANLMRVNVSQIPAADGAKINALAGRVDFGAVGLFQRRPGGRQARDHTTSVATLAHQFFAEAISRGEGVDYMTSPGAVVGDTHYW